jgi:serine/threonine protein kinase
MARLVVADDWRGRGEKIAAAVFERDLPADWTVIAGKKLPDADASDVDFIIVGKNCTFVVEEKAWRGAIIVNDENWELVSTRGFVKNPLKSTAYKARVLRGFFDERIGNFKNKMRNERPLKQLVVMSDPGVHLIGGQGNPTMENVFPLNVVVEEILKIDAARTTGLLAFRDTITTVLTGLPNSDNTLQWLRDYEVTHFVEELPNEVKVFRGAHKFTGQEVILKCFPQFLFGEDDPWIFFKREIDALRAVADRDRTWKLADAFNYEPRNWFCVATELPAGNRTLRNSAAQKDPARKNNLIEQATFEQVALDAFEGLAGIAEAGLVHRGISPDRVWLGPSMRVYFGDFNLCHIDEAQTVLHWVYSDPKGEGFRAPECAETIAFADHKSDVYSLALVIAGWYLGSFNTSLTDIRAALQEVGEVGLMLLAALDSSAQARPTAAELSEKLAEYLSPKPVSKEPPLEAVDNAEPVVERAPGVRIGENGRFELVEKLGSGGEASSWKTLDHNRGYHVVLKFLHSAELYSFAQREHLAVQNLHDPRLARSWDIQPKPEPGYLVQEYKEGCTLGDRSQFTISDGEELRRISIALFDILHYLESQRIVHGDLTPNNIIISDGLPALIDFGLTTPDGQPALGFNKLFAAPEVQAKRRVSHLSDIYGAACSLLEVALGRRVHGEDPDTGVAQTPIPLTKEESSMWGPSGSAVLTALFRGIAVDPENRPQSAQAFKDLLISARAIPELVPGVEPQINESVDELRKMYRASKLGNSGNRGLDTDFARATYVRTKLDTELIPRIIAGELSFVALTGNPGDGKTAFIKILQDALANQGAEFSEDSPTRWICSFGEHTICAILDASESNGDLTSDENLKWALDKVGTGNYTAVVAANDGRLLDFFTRNQHHFEELSLDVQRGIQGKSSFNPEYLVIDLKARALIGLDQEGPGLQILDAVTNDSLWSACHDCALNSRCSIFANRNALQGESRKAVADLLLTSHLRGQRRSTIRDVKSAIAWMITGDQGCEDIRKASDQGRNVLFENDSLLHDLVFSPETQDQLLEEWSSIDPARVINPAIERDFREMAVESPQSEAVALGISSYKRRIFMGDSDNRGRLSPYRHLKTYLSLLAHGESDILPRLLNGLSRIVGAHGYHEAGLAVADKYAESTWSVLKIAGELDFQLDVIGYSNSYIESIPEHVVLIHQPTGARLRVTLDLGELLIRASDGEILNDSAIESYQQELIGFATSVGRERTSHALLVDSNSRAWHVRQDGNNLVLEQANAF